MENKKPSTVILVDDDEDDRMIFEDAVAEVSTDVTVLVMRDGDELFTALNSSTTPPDIIFLDLNLPRKNGFECLKELRANKKFDSVFVIIYSTASAAREIDETFNRKANLFISKTNTYSELKNVLTHIFSLNLKDLFLFREQGKYVFNPPASIFLPD